MQAIALPASRPTNLVFAGPDLATICVTTMSAPVDRTAEPLAGAVFAIAAGVRGLAVPRAMAMHASRTT
jgi:sugar lactone lactonase YvrE